MYGFLRKFLPKIAADCLIIVWYLALIFLVAALSQSGQAVFRYLKV